MHEPDVHDVLRARRCIAPYLQPTPLHQNAALSSLLGADVWVKHENFQPTRAFKVRGGVNLVARLSDDERGRGVCTASTGNHGQSITFGARTFGVPATVCVPEGANPIKVESIRALGATVVHHGHDFDDARIACERFAAERGLRYVHSGDEPDLIAGVATEMLEVVEEQPDVDVVLVPIGGGSGAAGCCVVTAAIRPEIRVIGVQSGAAPSAYRSWQARAVVESPNTTAAEGLATRLPFELPQRILQRLLDDFVLVSEDELRSATLTMIGATRSLGELAAGAPLAAALRMRDDLRDRRVVLICTGGNINPTQLRDLFSASVNGST
ncbi:MAG TPA: threonine/serine dehydratase [Candidatus Dormibacteraeota bacterium]